jgi:hypothetical protein
MKDISQQILSNYYGLVWLQVATACYGSSGDKKSIPAVIKDFVENSMAAPPDPTNNGEPLEGYWSLDWGPGDTWDNSNLSILCSFRAPRPSFDEAGKPYFFVVGIRGTDTSVGGVALIQQILQDFNAFTQQDWKDVLADAPNPIVSKVPQDIKAKVSTGTAHGFLRIAKQKFSYKGKKVTIVEALDNLLGTYEQTPVIITGHSLGGCQTQVMAAYLAWQLCDTQSTSVGGAVIPHAFAPSTAGDPDFAKLYDTLFPYGGFWFNTLDLVPCGFTELNRIAAPKPYKTPELWTAYKWPLQSTYTFDNKYFDVSNTSVSACPKILVEAADVACKILPSYARPSNNQYEMPGEIPTPERLRKTMNLAQSVDPTSAAQVLMYNHFPQYYSQLVGAVSGVEPYKFAIALS